MLFRSLKEKEIECRVSKIQEKGLVLLLYKTARTDMAILDEVVGAEKWKCEYTEIKGNLYCGISIKTDNNEWVTKWDCGVESRDDGNGNEKKGEASDAFKRAGTKWGIGRELYSAPFIWIRSESCNIKQANGKYECKDRFFVSSIYIDEGEILELEISKEGSSVPVFSYIDKLAMNKMKQALIDYINAGFFEHPGNVEDVMKANDVVKMKRALAVAKAKETNNA